MAFKLANRVKMTVSGAPGTGSITLGSAITGYVSFATGGVADGDTVSYVIEDTGGAWEIGTGTYTASGTVLARTTVTASSAGGTTKISATSEALVFIAPLAADLQSTDTLTSGTLSVGRGGTGITSLTAGYVPIGNGTSALSSSAKLFWDGLHLSLGADTGDVIALRLRSANNNAASIQFTNDPVSAQNASIIGLDTGELRFSSTSLTSFYAAGSERMRIDSSGNVGIGVSNPAVRMHLKAPASNFVAFALENTNGGTNAKIVDFLSNGNDFSLRLVNDAYNAANAAYSITRSGTSVSNHIWYVGAAAEAMRIDSSGRVGIGTSPYNILDVYRSSNGVETIRINNDNAGASAQAQITLQSNASQINIAQGSTANNGGYGIMDIGTAGDFFFRKVNASGSFVWTTGGYTERMRITNDGLVGINTSSPGARLHVRGGNMWYSTSDFVLNTTGTVLAISTGASTGNTYGLINSTNAGGSAWTDLVLQSGGGNVGIGTPSPSFKIDCSVGTLGSTSGNTLSAFRLASSTGNADWVEFLWSRNASSPTSWATADFVIRRNIDATVGQHSLRFNGDTSTTFNWGASELMRIGSSGNVGIATASPAHKLSIGAQIGGTSTATPDVINIGSTYSNTAGANAKLRLFWDGLITYGLGVSASQLDYIISQSGSHVWYINGSERMRITSAGDVTIGNTASFGKFSVVGGNSYLGPASGVIPTNADSVYSAFIGSTAVVGAHTTHTAGSTTGGLLLNAYDFNNGSNYDAVSNIIAMPGTWTGNGNGSLLRFLTSATSSSSPVERMRIDKSGNVGIGSSPSDKLSVYVTPPAAGGSGLKITDGTRSTQINITGATYSYNGVGANEVLLYAGGGPLSLLADGQPIKFCSGGERMRITSGGRLGINLDPSYRFDLYDPSTSDISLGRFLSEPAATGISYSYIRIEKGANYGGAVGGYLSQGVGSGLVLSTINGGTLANQVWINNAGNVGIATQSPQSKFHVQNTSDGEIARFQRSGGSNVPILRINLVEGTGVAEIEQTGAVTGPIAFRTGGAERMRITSDGKVGIATSSPSVPLDVNGQIRALDGTVDLRMLPISGSGAGIVGTLSNHVLVVYTNNTERMRITSAGDVGIGTTSPIQNLDVAGGAIAVRGSRVVPATGNGMFLDFGGMAGASNCGIQGYDYGSAVARNVGIQPAGGKVMIGTITAGASKLTVADDSIQINTAKTPASATATGTTGQVCWDASYIYVCTATNTWKRAAIATW